MASYKTLWQEACREVEALKTEADRTREIVDLAGIALHMRVERYTPQQWRQRGYLPPPDFPRIKEPLWYASTIIEKFATPTGRLWYEFPPEGEPVEVEALSPAA